MQRLEQVELENKGESCLSTIHTKQGQCMCANRNIYGTQISRCSQWILLFSQYWPRDWLRRVSPKWPVLCRVGC